MKRIRINCMYISCIKTLIGQVVADYSECVLFPGLQKKKQTKKTFVWLFSRNFLICIIPLCIHYLIFRYMFYIMPFCFHNKF